MRRNLALWLWDRFRFSSPCVKVPLVAALCLALYGFAPGCLKDIAKSRLYWRDPLTAGFVENFGTADGAAASEKPWDYSGEQPRLVERESGEAGQCPRLVKGAKGFSLLPGNNSDGPDCALVIDGSQSFRLSPTAIDQTPVYDFILQFVIKFRQIPGQARWVFRAQPGADAVGYVFLLNVDAQGNLTLSGEVRDGWGYSYNFESAGDRTVSSPIKYSPNEWVEITANASDYTFSYQSRILSGTGDSDLEPVRPDFVDKRRRFRYGNIGIWQPPDNSIILDFWSLSDLGASIGCGAKPTPQP